MMWATEEPAQSRRWRKEDYVFLSER